MNIFTYILAYCGQWLLKAFLFWVSKPEHHTNLDVTSHTAMFLGFMEQRICEQCVLASLTLENWLITLPLLLFLHLLPALAHF